MTGTEAEAAAVAVASYPCQALDLLFEVTEPAVMGDGVPVGNTVTTLEYIPGSALRGAMAASWVASSGSPDATFARLFESEVRFLDARVARPEATSGWSRAKAVPMSWRRCKYASAHEPYEVRDLSQEPPSASREPQLCAQHIDKDKPCGGSWVAWSGWVQPNGEEITVATCDLTRTALGPDGTALESQLFTSSAIEPGQLFATRLVGPADALERLASAVWLDRGRELRVGRGRSVAGALEVRDVSLAPLGPSSDPDQLRTRLEESMERSGGFVPLYFASRVVLQDPSLFPEIAISSSRVVDGAEGGHPPPSYCGRTTVKGFNAAQGIPKNEDVALQAGSVVWWDAGHAEDPVAAAAALETYGVGLRRVEGFGEVEVCTDLHRSARVASKVRPG